MKHLRFTCGVWLVLGGLAATLYGQRASTPRPAATTVLRWQAPSFLGVAVMDVDSERAKALGLKEERGVEVKSVEDDSPAAKAGIKEGDVVLEYNGQRVDGTEQFMRLVRETPAGRQAKVAIWRGGATQTLTATIGSRTGPHFDRDSFTVAIPRPPEIRLDLPRPFTSWRSSTLGIESESLGSQLAEYFGVKEGALVRAVTKGSAADKAGIKAGDVIIKVDDKRVAGPREVTSYLRSSNSKRTFSFTVVREKREMTLSVTLDDNSRGDSGRGVRWMEGFDL